MLLVSYSYNAGAEASEKSLHDDGRSAIRFIQKSKIPSESIVVYGESLGTGVAVTIAVENKIGGVVLEAPYTSIADVAQSHYWYLPTRSWFWISSKLRTRLRILMHRCLLFMESEIRHSR